MVWLIAALSFLLLLLGAEMMLILGSTALLLKQAYFASMPEITLIQKMVGGVDHSTLLAVPFFLLAAELMSSGQIAERLSRLVKMLIGHWRGGLGNTTIGSAMFFGSVSGSAPATVAAIGKIMYPELRAAGYREKFGLGLIVTSAETAILIPPSITLIIYGWLTGQSITALFAGGLAVGLFLGLAFGALVMLESWRHGIAGAPRPPRSAVIQALKDAALPMGLPVIILGGIYSGFFTATEAAAVSVVYAFILEYFLYKAFDFAGFLRVIERGAIISSAVFVLLAMGSAIAFFVTLFQVPAMLLELFESSGLGLVSFLLFVNIIFLIAGMFIDPNSALLLLVPALFPVAVSFGVDPIHFGLVVTLNIGIAMITPPFGLDVFVASSALDKPVITVFRGVAPFVAVNLVVLLVITYVPGISTFLPRLLGW